MPSKGYPSTPHVRFMTGQDRPAIVAILEATSEFNPVEVSVAVEVIDSYLSDPDGSGYHVLIAELDSLIVGYVCYGPTPLTSGTWDMYWLAVSPEFKQRDVGSTLLKVAESKIEAQGGRLVLIETSSKPEYEITRRFHLSQGYTEIGRIPDFYAPGDDKVIYRKVIRL